MKLRRINKHRIAVKFHKSEYDPSSTFQRRKGWELDHPTARGEDLRGLRKVSDENLTKHLIYVKFRSGEILYYGNYDVSGVQDKIREAKKKVFTIFGTYNSNIFSLGF